MPRPREFEETVALDEVVRRFWMKGYSATSLRELERATGLGVTSLYNAFGGKRALFRAALQRYLEECVRSCIREAESRQTPSDCIHSFVQGVIKSALDDPEHKGCLLINTAIEVAPHDPEIAARVEAALREVEEFFRRTLEAAVASGEAAADLSPADTARSFSALMFGLRVLARARPDRETMEGAARPLLAMLGKTSNCRRQSA